MIDTPAGQPAPFLEARDQSGNRFRLADHLGRCVVLFFYPRDGTPVCTAQACAFRDSNAEFKALGAVVVGISADTDASHAAATANHSLGFALISDPDGRIRRSFGVRRWMGLLPARVTIVVDPRGTAHTVCRSVWRAGPHAVRALQAVRGFNKQGAANGAAP